MYMNYYLYFQIMSSRWNKSRPQSQTLPLDALLKENEHANRPVHAARSAGTVGKWGTTSFTSIRDRPIYGKQLNSNQLNVNIKSIQIHCRFCLVQSKSGYIISVSQHFGRSASRWTTNGRRNCRAQAEEILQEQEFSAGH